MFTTLNAALLRLALLFFALVPGAYAGWSSLNVAGETGSMSTGIV
jgi:hypothetical protein